MPLIYLQVRASGRPTPHLKTSYAQEKGFLVVQEKAKSWRRGSPVASAKLEEEKKEGGKTLSESPCASPPSHCQ